MLTRVAARTGRSVRAVAREPYALTLWTYLALAEHDRVEALLRRMERFDLAALVRLSVMDPKALAEAEQAFRRELEAPRPAERPDLAALLREYDNAMRRGRWTPAPPVH